MGKTPRYEYARLRAGEIRLLILPPGKPLDEIDCRIIHRELKSKPAFEALSYVWGSVDNSLTATCDPSGRWLSITQNLAKALKALRMEGAPRTLWVDAICINQNDNSEKSHQVRLMRRIYGQASKVIAWIGEESPADIGVRLLPQLIEQLKLIQESKDRNALPHFMRLDETDSKNQSDQVDVSRAWISLTRFIQRPWFSRVWIIQEACVNASLSLQFGQHTISWVSHQGAVAEIYLFYGVSGGDPRCLMAITYSSLKLQHLRMITGRCPNTAHVPLNCISMISVMKVQ